MEENKVVDFKIEDGNLIIKVDPNKDGENLIEIKVNMLEVPDEIISAIKK